MLLSTNVIQAVVERGVELSQLRSSDDRRLRTPLHLASFRRVSRAVLDTLVDECGVDLNAVDSFGNTCCHIAATHNNVEMVRFCVEAGADLERRDVLGATPLHAACLEGCDETVSLLIAAGANVHTRREDGETAVRASLGTAGMIFELHMLHA